MLLTQTIRMSALLITGFAFLTNTPLVCKYKAVENKSYLAALKSLTFKTDGLLFSENGDFSALKIGPRSYNTGGGLYGFYRTWNRAWSLPLSHGTISFTAKAFSDIAVGITRVDPWGKLPKNNHYGQMVDSKNLYEIVIGGWSDTASAIRRGSQGDAITSVGAGFPANVWVDYKVIIYKSPENNKNYISVYYKHPISNNNTWVNLITAEDNHFIEATQRWFSFSSWGTAIQYKNIQISSKTILPSTH